MYFGKFSIAQLFVGGIAAASALAASYAVAVSAWFEDLFGFDETETAVRANITIDGETMRWAANGRTFTCGSLATPSVVDLRTAAEDASPKLRRVGGSLRIR